MYSVELREYQLFQLRILNEFIRICELYDLKYYLAYGTLLGAVRHQGFIPWDDDIDVWMPADDYLKFREVAKTDLGEDYYFQSHETNPCNIIEWQRIGVTNSTSLPVDMADIHAEWGICIDIFPFAPAPDIASHAFKKLRKRVRLLYRVAEKYCYVHDMASTKGIRRLYYLFWSKIPDAVNVKWFKHLEDKVLHSATEEECEYYYDLCADNIFEKSWFASSIDLDFEGHKMNAPIGYKEVLTGQYGENWSELPPENQRVWHSGGGGEGFIVSLTEPYKQFLK